MSRFDKLLLKLLRGASDASFAFDDLRYILERLGFDERIRGSHHMFDRMTSRSWSTSSGTAKMPSRIRCGTSAV
jgi:hypothetical protein